MRFVRTGRPSHTVPIVDGSLVPTRDHTIAEQSKNYRYSTNHQVVIDADAPLVVAVGQPLQGNRNDGKAWELTGAKDTVGQILEARACCVPGPLEQAERHEPDVT